MRLRNCAAKMKLGQAVETTIAHRPFSALGAAAADVNRFLSETVRHKLAVPRWVAKDVCPVTEVQDMDIRATTSPPRTCVQYTLLYFSKEVDRGQLIRAFGRTVFVEHESTFLQVVIDDLDVVMITRQAGDHDLEQSVHKLCSADIETDWQPGAPFLRAFSVQGQDGQHCLVLGLSHTQYDGSSLLRLLEDLSTLYGGSRPVAEFLLFPAYMAHIHDKQVETKALTYWCDILRGSSLAVLDRGRRNDLLAIPVAGEKDLLNQGDGCRRG